MIAEILAAYQAARASGQAPDPREFLKSHPELAGHLAPLLAAHDPDGMAETLVPPDSQRPNGAGSPATAPTLDPLLGPPGMAPPDTPTLDAGGLPSSGGVPFTRDFGDYELLCEIARGGMGVVFKARQKSLPRIVALKMILAGHLASGEQVRRFSIEAEEAGRLDHPNIVPIYQVGVEQGQHYFSMKLIEGGSLTSHIPRLREDPEAAVRLMITVARAVHHAHQHGVLHRDLKPGNILLQESGVRSQESGVRGQQDRDSSGLTPVSCLLTPDSWTPHVTDFGLAKHLGEGADTQSGAIMGTPSYMAPEQAAARKNLTVAADVYGLGAVLYHLFTGRPPFQADNPFDVLVQVLEHEPARPTALNPRLPRDLETICLKCLAKDPARRYASAGAFADDLERYLADEPIHARPVGQLERAVKWVKRRPAAAALLAVTALAALGFLAFGFVYNARLEAANDKLEAANDNLKVAVGTAETERKKTEREKQESDRLRKLAEKRRLAAEAATKQFQAAKARAEEQERIATKSAAEALAQKKEADRLRKLAEERRAAAELATKEAKAATKKAIMAQARAEEQEKSAKKNAAEALAQKKEADKQRKESDRLRALAERRRMDAEAATRDAKLAQARAEEQEKVAQKNAAEARRQALLVRQGFDKRLALIDDFLMRMDGRLARKQGMASVRVEFLTDALAISQDILKENPKHELARRQTARIYRSMGDLWRQQEDGPRSNNAYLQALKLQTGLAREFPAKLVYKDDLSLTYASRARLLQEYGKHADGKTAFRQAIALQEELAAKAEDKFLHRFRVNRFRFELANLMEEARLLGDAAKTYRRALADQDKLAKDFPKRDLAPAEAAETANTLAMLLAEKNPPELEGLLERSVRGMAQAVRLARDNKYYQRKLREYYGDLAEHYKATGQHAKLAGLAAGVRRDLPDSPDDSYNAACLVANAVTVALKHPKVPAADRPKLAEGYGKQAVEILGKAVKEGFTDRANMTKDKDLDPLRGRADFKKLLADLDKRFPAEKLSPAKEFLALVKEWEDAVDGYANAMDMAQTVAERKKAQKKLPRFAEWAQQFLDLAQKHKTTGAAVDALTWVLITAAPGEATPSPATAAIRKKALQSLVQDHFQKKELGNVCQRLAKKPLPECNALLKAALEKHGQEEVRGLAGYALAISLANQAAQARRAGRPEAKQYLDKAIERLEEVRQKYRQIPCGSTTLGEAAQTKLHELRYLTQGRQAQEIDGTDLGGKKLKLSDYRGQVVVLFFWADWCGYCRQMYPTQRALVDKMKGKPFAVLGVNCDDNKPDAVRVVDKEKINWKSWWDGPEGGRTAKLWQANALPRIYVLDHKGVIRYINLRGADLEAAVTKLLKEREAELKKKPNK
jgi:thiol-disulfide isomerase/thioredoxin